MAFKIVFFWSMFHVLCYLLTVFVINCGLSTSNKDYDDDDDDPQNTADQRAL